MSNRNSRDDGMASYGTPPPRMTFPTRNTLTSTSQSSVQRGGGAAGRPLPQWAQGQSYYSIQSEEERYRILLASDVTRQVGEAPREHGAHGVYPRRFHNQPPLPLSSPPPHTEYPLVPSPRNGLPRGNYVRGARAGLVRAIWSDDNPSRFDVVYHHDKKPRGPKVQSRPQNTNFTMATYYPAPGEAAGGRAGGGGGYFANVPVTPPRQTTRGFYSGR